MRDYYAAIAPHSEAGGYINFASADDQAKVAGNYGANYGGCARSSGGTTPTTCST